MATGAVISGATRGPGGPALGRHLADRRRIRQNDRTLLGAMRGIVSEEIEFAIAELTRISSHARSKQQLYHVHLDPQFPWTEQQFERHWELFEEEFGFQNQPFVEVVHFKHDRLHKHRVYSRVLRSGNVIPLKYDYMRREKLSRIAEFEFNGTHIAGRHNWAVENALKKEARFDVLESVRAAGLTTAKRPEAKMTPDERHQFERTAMDPSRVAAVALSAWHSTDSADDLIKALALQGLRLVMGDKVPVLIDLAGGAHSLTRLIGKASAAAGMRIKAKDVQARIAGVDLTPYQPKGETHRDEIEDTSADSLVTQNNYRSFEGQAQRRNRLGSKSQKDHGLGGRLRLDRARIRDASRAGQHRDDEVALGPVGDPTAGRAHKSRKNSDPVGGSRQIEWAAPQRPSPSRRATGRARTTDSRLERILDEPEFQPRIDRLVAWTALLDPGAALRQRAEEARVQMMLDEPEFGSAISAIAAAAVLLLRLLAWFVGLLFGSDGQAEWQDMVADSAPSEAPEPELPAP